MHHLQHAKFKMKPLLLAVTKLVVRTQDDVEEAGEVLLRKQCRRTRNLLSLVS